VLDAFALGSGAVSETLLADACSRRLAAANPDAEIERALMHPV
jgi:hypothetical protein